MKKIVFLGAKKIGFECLAQLFARQKELDYEIIAVGTSHRGVEIKEFCKTHNIKEIQNLDDLLELEFDLLFSVQYHLILRQEHINCAREIAFNLHLAPLPEYRGCNQFSFAILNEDREFGVTLHKMDCGIDSGDIIFERRFAIPKDCFVGDLVELANQEGLQLFCEKLPCLINGEYEFIPQSNCVALKREFHYRREIEALKCVDLYGGGALIEKVIRATAMPGFEPPYCIIGGRKFCFISKSDS